MTIYTNYTEIPKAAYNLVYLDPPWPYTSFGTAKLQYRTMTWEAIKCLPIQDIMAKECVLFMWITSPLAAQQYRVIIHWIDTHKLTFQGEPFVWVKTRKDGNPLGATGPRPRLTKPLSERLVCLSNTGNKRPFPLANDATCQTVFETEDVWTQREGHSVKPAIFREKIVNLFKDSDQLKKIELFSRREVPGWDHFGDEVVCSPT